MAPLNSINTNNEKKNPNQLSEPQSEAHLVAGAKGGSCVSFELVQAPHAMRLLTTALSITRNREDAEDALQDCLMRAYVRINDFRGASSFATWLTRIAINSALMVRRKNRGTYICINDMTEPGESRSNVDILHTAPDPEQTFVAQERKRALREAISTLQPSESSRVCESGNVSED